MAVNCGYIGTNDYNLGSEDREFMIWVRYEYIIQIECYNARIYSMNMLNKNVKQFIKNEKHFRFVNINITIQSLFKYNVI